MRIRSTCPLIIVAALLAAFVPPALAQVDQVEAGQYDITGTWYASNSLGNYLVYTITRLGPNEYTPNIDILTATDLFGMGSTKLTAIGATLRRSGVNTYDYTSLWYYGDGNSTTPAGLAAGAIGHSAASSSPGIPSTIRTPSAGAGCGIRSTTSPTAFRSTSPVPHRSSRSPSRQPAAALSFRRK